MSDPRPHSLRRLLAIFLACVYVTGAFGGLIHIAAVEHERCAEHGEIVHAEAPLERPDAFVPVFDQRQLRASERGEAHAEHDHCLVTVPCSPDVLALTHTNVVEPLEHEAPSGSVVLVAQLTERSEPLYLLAPKHGPPA